MEHTSRAMQITIHSMGAFMTASEANRQRVLTLLLVEDEQMLGLAWYDLDKKSRTTTRDEALMSETPQLSISGRSDNFQLALF
jgi:hypothetical protein